MKVIRYKLSGNLLPVTMPYNEGNEQMAKQEAYNGIYTIDDVEQEQEAPTITEQLNELTEAVNLLLEGAQE